MMFDRANNIVKLPVQLVRLEHAKDFPMPEYQTPGAAGVDLMAAIPEDEKLVISPGQIRMVPTGIKIGLPNGYEAQIRSRSGLVLKQRLSVGNSPGTIDWDYRGEIKVLLQNEGTEPQIIERRMRIAQMVIAPVVRAQFEESFELGETERGAGGFGSTGVE